MYYFVVMKQPNERQFSSRKAEMNDRSVIILLYQSKLFGNMISHGMILQYLCIQLESSRYFVILHI